MRSDAPSPPNCRSGFALAGLLLTPKYRRCRPIRPSQPIGEPVVECLVRTIDIWRIDPAAAGLQHVHDAADDTPVVDPRFTSRIARQKWGKPRKLVFRQPETIAIHRRPPVGDRESHICRKGNLYGSGP